MGVYSKRSPPFSIQLKIGGKSVVKSFNRASDLADFWERCRPGDIEYWHKRYNGSPESESEISQKKT